MIKIKLRRNLIYLLIYFICAFLDYSVLGLVIPRVTGFNTLYICIYLYPIENIIGGLVVFLYQKYSIRKKEKTQYFGIKFNKNKGARDGKFKKILLVFFAAYFNFYRFIFYAFNRNIYINATMDLKLTTIQIIISTIIYIYAFEFKFKKHHKISLIIISIFLFLSMSTDIIYIIYYKFRLIKVPVLQYFIALFFYIGYSFNNCIEKYLVDYNYMNPFIILMLEGVFEFIMASISFIIMDPFSPFANITGSLGLFIFLFILYTLLQVIVNIYRIYCNVIYSPMARSLVDYLLNPIINIYTFFALGDFYYNVAYFIIIEIISIVISFFGCVFNEYIILYCFGLERETQDKIAERAKNQFQKELNDMSTIIYNNENDDDIRKSSTIISYDGFGLEI